MYVLLNEFADHIGLIGVVLTLIAYGALSIGKIDSESFSYSFMNFLGSWLILVSLIFHWNLSSFVIEVAWILISMIGMYRFFMNRNNSKKKVNQSNLYVISNQDRKASPSQL